MKTAVNRVLSLFLTCAMLFGFVSVPAFAATAGDNLTFTLTARTLDYATGTVGDLISGETKLQAGQCIAVAINMDQTSLGALQLRLKYDNTLLEYLWDYNKEKNKNNKFKFNNKDGSSWSLFEQIGSFSVVVNGYQGESDAVNFVGSDTEAMGCEVDGELVYVPFRVKGDVESASNCTLFWFDAEDGAVTEAKFYDDEGNNYAYTCVLGDPFVRDINGVAPTLTDGTLVLNDGVAVAPLTVRGSNTADGGTLTVTSLKSKGGTTLTTDTNVTYTVVKGEETLDWLITRNTEAGTVTVTADPNAVAGDDYYVVATGDGTNVTGSISSAAFSVTREASELKGIKVLDADNAALADGASVTVNGTGTTTELTVSGLDQFGDSYKSISVAAATGEGYSTSQSWVSGSTVIIPGDTADKTPLKITARDTADGHSATAERTLTINRAESAATTIEISGVDSLTINTSAEVTSDDYTAKVYDQFGVEMKDQSIKWHLNTIFGVSLNASTTWARLTVASTANPGTVTLYAYQGTDFDHRTLAGEKTVSIYSLNFPATITVTTKETPTYGDTWNDIVTGVQIGEGAAADITKDGIAYTAKVGSNDVAGKIFLADADATPDAGARTAASYFTADDSTYQNIPVPASIITGADVTVAQKEVGLTWGNTALTYSGNSQKPTATATGTVNSDEITVTVTGDQTNAGSYTATASELYGAKSGNYKLPESNTQSFTIDQKALTLTWPAATSFVYGNSYSMAVTGTGAVSGDTVELTYTYAGSGTTVYASSTTPPTAVGTYTVTVTGCGNDNYTLEGVENTSCDFAIIRKAPEAADFTFTAPSGDLKFAPAATWAATVAPNTGVDGMGAVTVKYAAGSETPIAKAPTDAGTYKVSISVAEGANYSATTTDLTSDSWTFTVARADVEIATTADAAAFKYTKSDFAVAGLLNLGDTPTGYLTGTETYTYAFASGQSNTLTGKFTLDTANGTLQYKDQTSEFGDPVDVRVVVTRAATKNLNAATKEFTITCQGKDTAYVVADLGTTPATYTGAAQVLPTITKDAYTKASDYTDSDKVPNNATEANWTVEWYQGATKLTDPDSQVIDAGEYTVKISYTDSDYASAVVEKTFTVTPITLTASDFALAEDSALTKEYDGTTASTAGLVVANSAVKTRDGTVTATLATTNGAVYNSADVATANTITFTVTGVSSSNYTIGGEPLTVTAKAKDGNITGTVGITPKTVTPTIDAIDAQTYTGSPITPEITVKIGSQQTLVKDTDYTVTYGENVNVGTTGGCVSIAPKTGSNYTFTTSASNTTATFAITAADVSETATVEVTAGLTYTGEGQEPGSIVVKAKSDGDALTAGTDYDVAYQVANVENNANAKLTTGEAAKPLNAGSYVAVITFKGNYTGTKTSEAFTIAPAVASGYTVSLYDKAGDTTTKDTWNYTGKAIVPFVKITNSDTELKVNQDYTLVYSNNTNVKASGEADAPQVAVTFKGNYTGTQTVKFTIAAASLESAKVTVPAAFVYDGTGKKPDPTVSMGGKTLTKTADYTVTYQKATGGAETTWSDCESAVGAGVYRAVVSGAGNYTGTAYAEFTIEKQNAANAVVTLTNASVTYTGNAIEASLSKITIGSEEITSFDGCTISYQAGTGTLDSGKPLTAGTYTVFVEFPTSSNYKDKASASFEILPKDMKDVEVTAPSTQTWTGEEIKPTITISGLTPYNATEKTGDYTVAYANNTEIGEATVTVVGWGNYTGRKVLTFDIEAVSLGDAEISTIAAQTYTGSPITPAITVTLGGKTLVENTDYTVSYSSNTGVGEATATVTVTGIGCYAETKSAKFTIQNADQTLSVSDGSLMIGDHTLDLNTLVSGAKGTLTFTKTAGDKFTLDGSTLTTTATAADLAGGAVTADITVQAATATGYNASAEETIKVTAINKNPATLGTTAGSKTYTGAELEANAATFSGTASGTPKWTYSYAVKSVEGNSNARLGATGKPLNAGVYTVTAIYEDNSNYGTATYDFTVTPVSITGAALTIADKVYSGSVQTAEIGAVTLSGKALTATTDYTVKTNEGGTDVDTYSVVVAGAGNYTGEASGTFAITPKPLTAAMVSLSGDTGLTYDNTAKTVTVTVTDGNELTAGTDYTVAGNVQTNAGDYDITVTGTGNYTGTLTKNFSIAKAERGAITVSAKQSNGETALDGNKLTYLIPTGKLAVTYTNNADNSAAAVTKFVSNDPSVITVTSAGVITAKGNGGTTITVTVGETANYKAATTTIALTAELDAISALGTVTGMQPKTNASAVLEGHKITVSGMIAFSGALTETLTIRYTKADGTSASKNVVLKKSDSGDISIQTGADFGDGYTVVLAAEGVSAAPDQLDEVTAAESEVKVPETVKNANGNTVAPADKATATTAASSAESENLASSVNNVVNQVANKVNEMVETNKEALQAAGFDPDATENENKGYEIKMEIGLDIKVDETYQKETSENTPASFKMEIKPQYIVKAVGTSNGQEIELEKKEIQNDDLNKNQKIKIEIPLPKGFTWTGNLFVKHTPTGGSKVERLAATVNNQIITFFTTGFSTFEIVDDIKGNVDVYLTERDSQGMISLGSGELDQDFPLDTSITPAPADGSEFYGWAFKENTEPDKDLTVKNGTISITSELIEKLHTAKESTDTTKYEKDGSGRVILYAVWKYPVKVNKTGDGTASADKTMTWPGDTVTLTATPTGNASFDGWSVTEGDASIDDPAANSTTFTMTSSPVTVTAAFGKNTSGGGGAVVVVPDTVVVSDGVANGTLEFSNAKAKAGDKVTIIPKANEGYKLASIVVKDENGNVIPTSKNADGSYTFKMPESGTVTVTPTFEKDTAPKFVDVPANDYYAKAVDWAVENGITTGTSATTFSPDNACTRAEAVTFLYRAAGSPEIEPTSQFTDVSADSYYAKAVAWAVANGITKGTGDGTTFSPNEKCSRAQIVTFLFRYEKAEAGTSTFTDVPADSYYAGAVGWAVENGITNGTGNGTTFSPNDVCTRAQIVTFLYRCFNK